MKNPRRSLSDRLLPTAFLGLAVLTACAGGDPTQALVEHRAGHSVELLSWADQGGGKVVAVVSVRGPVYSELEQLTVEFQGRAADDAVILSQWVTLDLSQMERGTPFERTVVLEGDSVGLEALAVNMHRNPTTPEVMDRLVELRQAP